MTTRGSAPRVLVVDDRLEMAEMIADDLCDRGYESLTASSGGDALHLLRTEHVDALITDLRMPEIDGLRLLRESKLLDPSRPVILMTAYGSMSTAVDAVGEGAAHYMVKPFRLDALLQVLERALGRRSG